MKTELVYDELCAWPYHQPYGLVTVVVPKVKKPRKPRQARAITKPKFKKRKK